MQAHLLSGGVGGSEVSLIPYTTVVIIVIIIVIIINIIIVIVIIIVVIIRVANIVFQKSLETSPSA